MNNLVTKSSFLTFLLHLIRGSSASSEQQLATEQQQRLPKGKSKILELF